MEPLPQTTDSSRDSIRIAECWADLTRALTLYPENNSRVLQSLAAFIEVLREYFGQVSRIEIGFSVKNVWVGDDAYPQTIHRVRQSIGTRIIKICGVYEALTAVRPHKPRMPPVRAYRIMISMKNHFDPVLLRRFIASNGIFPIGSLVQLSTGEQARIPKQTADPHKPIIQVEFDELGSELGPDETLIRDLSRAVGGPPSEILKIVDSAA